MSTNSAQSPNPQNEDDTALAVPPAGGLLSRLHGLDSADAITLVGRNRLSQALELEEKPDNRYLRLSLYLFGGAVLIFFPWAAFTPITQVVNASGEVVPEGGVNVVQHLEGGLVSKVYVRDGEEVRKGQVLLELNPQLVGSEHGAAEQQLENLLLQQKQLQAAIRGERVISPTPGVKSGNKVNTAQLNLLNSRLDNKGDQVAAMQASVAQKREELAGLDSQIALYDQQRKMWARLVASGAASKLQLIDTETRLAQTRSARAATAQALAQAQANLRGIQSGLRFEQNSQIAQLVNEEAVVAENIKKVRNQLERTKVKAPVDGVVSDLRFKASGAVVGPGAVLLQVVPSSSQKLVEVRIPSPDIGFVKVGQSVDVKLQPFDSTIYGAVPGRVISIAGTTVQDPDDRTYSYLARIKLDRQYLDAANRRYPIQVGMPLVADIKGQQRSVLRYLFQPFTRTLDSALRESR
jgi:adhesin transport system membrane fusion protein